MKDWIELFPYGVTIESEGFASPNRPVMLFKNKDETRVLPVWISPLEAGMILSRPLHQRENFYPHNLGGNILNSLGIKLEKCIFVDVKGLCQYVDLYFSGSDKIKKLQSSADEAISFCLSMNTRFYCQSEFIDRCRILDGEIHKGRPLEGGIQEGPPTYLN